MNPLKQILNWLSGAAKKVLSALAVGNNVANAIKDGIDSPMLTAIATLNIADINPQSLAYIQSKLSVWIAKMGWATKKLSDFDETTLPHVMNAINAEAAKLHAEFTKADLSRQQAIAGAQVVYDKEIVK